MKEEYKYRFKTKEEFIKEFGEKWRGLVYFEPTGAMDYLCGEILKLNIDENSFKYEHTDTKWLLNKYDGWLISKKMVTLIKKEPNYSPRKIIRNI